MRTDRSHSLALAATKLNLVAGLPVLTADQVRYNFFRPRGVPASPERSHMKRDAAKRALVAERLGQDMIRGTEATTRAREVRAESRRVRHHGPRDDQPHDRPLTAADRPRPGAAYEPYGSPNGRNVRNVRACSRRWPHAAAARCPRTAAGTSAAWPS